MATKPLSIKDWKVGVGESPYVGFGQMVNIDIFSKPGSALISQRLERDVNSVGVVTELIIWDDQDPRTGDYYGVDRQGTLYKRSAGTTLWNVITGHGTTGALGQGLVIWKDYIIYARANRLDVYGPLTTTPTWTNNWQTIESSDTHPMIVGADDRVYIGNLNFIDTLGEVFAQTFNPANGATYSYSSQALPLRSGYKVTTLEELGANIAIGTTFGINGSFNIADMFFWDGFSEFISANQTVRFAEDGVQMTKNAGNTLWTIAGTGIPRIFRSVTSQGVEARRLNNIGDGTVRLFPSAIEQKEGEILFGIGQSFGAGGVNPMGVYSVRNDGSLTYVNRYTISTGNDGSDGTLLIGTIRLINATELLVSWYDSRDSSVFGVDVLSAGFYTTYEARIESPIYTVGTEDDPTTYEEVEVRLGKRLKSGDGVRLWARKSLDEDYVLIATFDTPTYIGRSFMKKKVGNVSKFKDAQFLIELTTAENSVESPELKEVVLI